MKKTHKTHDAIILGAIIPDGDNGKSQLYIATTNDGYRDLRLALDVDDCDKAFARAWMKRIIACVEAQRGLDEVKRANLGIVEDRPRAKKKAPKPVRDMAALTDKTLLELRKRSVMRGARADKR